MMIHRRRPGFTFIEVITVFVIAAGVFLGFIILLLDVNEQMHISWELREAEDYGHWYVNQFVDKMRNGLEAQLLRETAPGEAEVKFFTPHEYSLPEAQRVANVYKFQYNYDTSFPQIRVDGQVQDYEFFPSKNQDADDEFTVDPESFRIYQSTRALPDDQNIWRQNYLTIEFNITYRHYSGFGNRNLYEKTMPFAGSAYVANDQWPVIKPPEGLE